MDNLNGKFESTITEILEVKKIKLDDPLSSFDTWDSLTRLSIIAFCSDAYNVSLSAEEIENSETIGGLKELISSKMTDA